MTEYEAFCLATEKRTPNRITVDPKTRTAWCSDCPLNIKGICNVEPITVRAFLSYRKLNDYIYRNSK